MTLPVLFTEPAREDLDHAISHLFWRNPRAALNLTDAVETSMQLLSAGTMEGAEVRLTTGEAVRRWVVAPLVIYYERRADALVVLYVHDGRRSPIEQR